MKKFALMLVVFALAGCGDSTAPSSATQAEAALVEPLPAAHYYSLEDGTEYGYEPAISQNDQESGMVAKSMVMFRYAGQRDGKHQVYAKDGSNMTVIECANPCEFMKLMSFYDGEFVNKELIRAKEGSMGWSAISDGINGFMKPTVKVKNGKSIRLWFDEAGAHLVPAG